MDDHDMLFEEMKPLRRFPKNRGELITFDGDGRRFRRAFDYIYVDGPDGFDGPFPARGIRIGVGSLRMTQNDEVRGLLVQTVARRTDWLGVLQLAALFFCIGVFFERWHH